MIFACVESHDVECVAQCFMHSVQCSSGVAAEIISTRPSCIIRIIGNCKSAALRSLDDPACEGVE